MTSIMQCTASILLIDSTSWIRLAEFLIGKYHGFCYVIFNSHMFNAPRFNSEKDVSLQNCLLEMRPIHLWRSRTPDGVRCAHFPSVITTIMDHKVQLIKPLNLGELYTV
jgi:hypothetical protein